MNAILRFSRICAFLDLPAHHVPICSLPQVASFPELAELIWNPSATRIVNSGAVAECARPIHSAQKERPRSEAQALRLASPDLSPATTFLARHQLRSQGGLWARTAILLDALRAKRYNRIACPAKSCFRRLFLTIVFSLPQDLACSALSEPRASACLHQLPHLEQSPRSISQNKIPKTKGRRTL